jgi:hypothetical protein
MLIKLGSLKSESIAGRRVNVIHWLLGFRSPKYASALVTKNVRHQDHKQDVHSKTYSSRGFAIPDS